MTKYEFSELQQLEKTVFSHIIREENQGAMVKAGSMGAYLQNYGQVNTLMMCFRRSPLSEYKIDMCAIVKDGSEVVRLEYDSTCLFMKFLSMRMKALGITLGEMPEDEWQEEIRQAKHLVAHC